MTDVTPRFKDPPKKKRRRKGLSPIGKKTLLDKGELANTRIVLVRRSGDHCEARFSPDCTGWGAVQHHVIRRSQGGANHEANLLWVCVPCHSTIHAHPEAAIERGLLRRSYE